MLSTSVAPVISNSEVTINWSLTDPVTRFNAQGEQPGGQPVHLLLELGPIPADVLVTHYQGLALGIAQHNLIEVIADGLVDDLSFRCPAEVALLEICHSIISKSTFNLKQSMPTIVEELKKALGESKVEYLTEPIASPAA